MKLVKLDYGAEVRDLDSFRPFGKYYYEVECPFCGLLNIVYYRNFRRGVRCGITDCRAMLYLPTRTATRDMLPKNETVLVHGLRTSIWVAETERKESRSEDRGDQSRAVHLGTLQL